MDTQPSKIANGTVPGHEMEENKIHLPTDVEVISWHLVQAHILHGSNWIARVELSTVAESRALHLTQI